MERIILPNKQKVTKLGIKLGVIITIVFMVFLIALFFIVTFKFASNNSLSFVQALIMSFHYFKEEGGLMFFWLLSCYLLVVISPFINLHSSLKKGTVRVVLNKDGIISQAGFLKKFVAWDNFIQVLPTKIVWRILMSGGRSGTVFVIDMFDLVELNSEINIFRNKELISR